MEIMKYPSVSATTNLASGGGAGAPHHATSHVDVEVESLFTASCWGGSGGGGGGSSNASPPPAGTTSPGGSDYKLMLDSATLGSSDKLLLGSPCAMDDVSDSELGGAKSSMDDLDTLLISSHHHHHHNHHHQHNQSSTSLAELKPLPPFTGYTANLSINGIQGHHYHAIAQRIPEENNNYSAYGNGAGSGDHNIVSSSTCTSNHMAADSTDSCAKSLYGDDVYGVVDSASAKLYADNGAHDHLQPTMTAHTHQAPAQQQHQQQHPQHQQHIIKTEMAEYDISSIEDIAAIIGSAIADTTVPNPNVTDEEAGGSRDSWMDLDAWIDGACVDQSSQHTKSMVITQDGLSDFMIPVAAATTTAATTAASPEYAKVPDYKPAPPVSAAAQTTGGGGGSTLQTLLTHGYMPLLQNRLQNGPPSITIKQEMPSSTNYASSTDHLISTSSPPSNVVSTTADSLLMAANSRFLNHYSLSASTNGANPNLGDSDRSMRSPDLLASYPHTTTSNSTPTSGASKKARNRAQKKLQQQQQMQHQHQQQQQAASSTVFQAEQSLGMLGKEKPVHRCSICNRGFLNKSNIKVHLRTHTGEKPFRCDTCAKAFRQKAHLLKHQQIHKRIGRD